MVTGFQGISIYNVGQKQDIMSSYLYKKAMVIDDSKLDRYICTAAIERNFFAEEISNFNSGVEALDYLKTLDSPDAFPEIIFLDINMPVMNGFDFLDSYLKLPKQAQEHCNVVMISSSESSEDFKRLKSYPCVQMFFSKPFSNSILNTIRGNSGQNHVS